MSLHRCFIQSLQHLATLKVLQPLHSLPLYCEGERERGNDRDRLFTTTPSFLPVLARGRERGGGWGTLGRQHNCEGSSLELRAAQRVIEWSSASGPPESWILRVGGLHSPHPFSPSLSNSPARSLVLLLSQHLQEKRLAHPLWPALELWCGSQWHRLDSFRARLESLMGELRGQTHRGSRCLCCCEVLLVGSFHSHY